jgi:fructose-specific component phosphotransferase system IIB-like protein
MMRRIKTALFVAFFVSCSCAQLRNMAVDETQVLRDAKKVAVLIRLRAPAAAPYRPDFERAKKQIGAKLAKQKLHLVSEPADADIVIVATEFNEDRGAVASATTTGQTTTAVMHDMICLGDEVNVFKGGKAPSDSDAPIWSASEVCGFSWPLNRAMERLAKAMRK